MAKKEVVPTRAAADALAVLGSQVRLARHDRNWTAADLGARIGVTARTVTAIERGSPGVAVGTVFNAASVVGLQLFGAGEAGLARLRRQGEERVALIPSREYAPRSAKDDDGLDF
ncbi:helix-turn-helix transcriptional regulator [Microlunatus parietis]|uniref:Transcriptional regulator with XRE-family HTH domain n=1 Tax=Microlunatus parietis TaxID=682979 RepID=A0A7Y9I364_9ACTN|nr:helix-turn-helix transcriptional regulator [Microlunatus parietis]NYE69367.1 transcriptional regulator with XRE-family HTH domain [Microlunatus parietis]